MPCYRRPAVDALLARSRPVPFLEPVPLCGGRIRATFFPAAHVLGAAAVGLGTAEGRVLITGDVCRPALAVVGLAQDASASMNRTSASYSTTRGMSGCVC